MNFGISKVFKTYEINTLYNHNSVKKTNKEEKRDTIEISNKGKDFQKIMNIVSNVPDIRESKVYEIKNKIENNKYNISSIAIAEKIINNCDMIFF